MTRDEHDRELFLRAFAPPGRPYVVGQPFDADELLDGFELIDERQVPVPPDSLLGRTMAAYRERPARGEIEPLDPATFTITPVPVELDDD